MLQYFLFNAFKSDVCYLLIYIYFSIYYHILPFDNEQCNYKIETIIIIVCLNHLHLKHINIA